LSFSCFFPSALVGPTFAPVFLRKSIARVKIAHTTLLRVRHMRTLDFLARRPDILTMTKAQRIVTLAEGLRSSAPDGSVAILRRTLRAASGIVRDVQADAYLSEALTQLANEAMGLAMKLLMGDADKVIADIRAAAAQCAPTISQDLSEGD
jgi:hypothetical protein